MKYDSQTQNKTSWYQVINANRLKLIALVTMFIDHAAIALLSMSMDAALWHDISPEKLQCAYDMMRKVGRTAFPIFAFFIVEGFFRTKNRKAYLGRLLLFAILSEVPFDLALFGKIQVARQNTLFTLAIGLATIWLMEKAKQRLIATGQEGIVQLFILLAGCMIAVVCGTDYRYHGIALIGIFYLFREKRWCACLIGYLSMLYEPFCLPGFLLIMCYNRKKGRNGRIWKYAFYFLYPLHFLFLYGIRTFL